jgi:dihydroorotate dehydrogenase
VLPAAAMYRLVFERFLAYLDAELAHRLGFGLLRIALALPGIRAWLRARLAPPDPALAIKVFDREFDSPLGLAAGFDKDGVGYEQLHALGFGFVEVGTLTARAQPGNPRPRMFRVVRLRALINRLGFNNGGADAAVARVSKAREMPLGINIGKSKVTPEAEATADYVHSAYKLGAHADYVVVNVSSPNTPGLRNLQAVELLRPLLTSVRGTLDRVSPRRHVPLLVKIAPDLANEDVDAVADMALDLRLDGIIATNTTIGRASLSASEVERLGAGGLSGAPLKDRALQVLRRLYGRVGSRLVLVGVGGIESAEDVFTRMQAGATLVQAYTGFVYGGPRWPSRVRRELSQLLAERGYRNVREIIGRDA